MLVASEASRYWSMAPAAGGFTPDKAAVLTLHQAAVLLEVVEQGVPDGLLAEHLGVAQHHKAVPAGQAAIGAGQGV